MFESQPPLSELIMDAATKHLSEEALYRTPKESYEKILWDEEKAEKRLLFVPTGGDSDVNEQAEEKQSFVQQWQQSRKEDELKESELNSSM